MEIEGSSQAPVMSLVTSQSDQIAFPCTGPSTQAPGSPGPSPTAEFPYSGPASWDTSWTCENTSSNISPLDPRTSHCSGTQVSLPYLMREPAGRDTTGALNACVYHSLFSHVSSFSIDEDLYQSILAYGVLYGWDKSIEMHAKYCPLLGTIRFLDEFFLYDVGTLNRLSIIYVVLKQLQVSSFSIHGTIVRLPTEY